MLYFRFDLFLILLLFTSCLLFGGIMIYNDSFGFIPSGKVLDITIFPLSPSIEVEYYPCRYLAFGLIPNKIYGKWQFLSNPTFQSTLQLDSKGNIIIYLQKRRFLFILNYLSISNTFNIFDRSQEWQLSTMIESYNILPDEYIQFGTNLIAGVKSLISHIFAELKFEPVVVGIRWGGENNCDIWLSVSF